MAQTRHEVSARNAFAEHIRTATENGDVQFQVAQGGAALATVPLGVGSWGAAVAGVITASNLPQEDSNASAGTTTWAYVRSSGSSNIVGGDVSVTGGGGAFQLSSTTFDAGDTVRLTSLTYTASL